MFKIIARPAPYSTYALNLTKDTVKEVSEENWEKELDEILAAGNYWMVEVLKPTENGKMISICTEYPSKYPKNK